LSSFGLRGVDALLGLDIAKIYGISSLVSFGALAIRFLNDDGSRDGKSWPAIAALILGGYIGGKPRIYG